MFLYNSFLFCTFLTLTFLTNQDADCAAGSKEDVHYMFLAAEDELRIANPQEVFHDYKPECVQITSDLYPCNNMQYKGMRMPNLLNQRMIQEAKSVLMGFGDERFLSCDKYAREFLCSLVTPVCFVASPHIKVPPCKRLCNRVRDKCFHHLYDAGFGVPGGFNCSNFEDIQPCLDPTADISTTPIPPMPWTRKVGPPVDHRNNSKEDTQRNNKKEKTTPTPAWTAKSSTEGAAPSNLIRGEEAFNGTVVMSSSLIVTEEQVSQAVCHTLTSQLQEASTIIVRGRLKSIREKKKGRLVMKVKKKNLKLFYDRNSSLTEEEGIPFYKAKSLDEFFFKSYDQVKYEDVSAPLKNEVVYFFISRLDSEISKGEIEEFFRVQFMVPDDGSSRLRELMNSAGKNQLDCLSASSEDSNEIN